MAVFPENMNRLPSEPERAINTLDDYIRYMRERVEFAFENMTKNVSAVGVSSIELYKEVQEVLGDLTALASRVANLQTDVTTHTGNTGIHVTSSAKTSYLTQLRSSMRPVASGATIYGTQLIFWNGSAWRSITNSRSTGTTKTRMSDGIPDPQNVQYYSGTAAVASGSQAAASTIFRARDALDFRYSANCGTTLTAHAPLYLVWTIGNDGLFYLAPTWWTQTLPSTADGNVYEYIGDTYSTYQYNLAPSHPLLVYKDGGIRPFS